jgi:hypothetical protein
MRLLLSGARLAARAALVVGGKGAPASTTDAHGPALTERLRRGVGEWLGLAHPTNSSGNNRSMR